MDNQGTPLTPEQISAIVNPEVPNAQPPIAPVAEQASPDMISEQPFKFSSPDPFLEQGPSPLAVPPQPASPFAVGPSSDLLAEQPFNIVAAPFSLGSFDGYSPPPPVVPVQPKLVPINRPTPVVVKPKVKRRRTKSPPSSSMRVTK